MKDENKKKIQEAIKKDYDKSVEQQDQINTIFKKQKDNKEKIKTFVASNYRHVSKLVKDIASDNYDTMLDQFRVVSNEHEPNDIDKVTKSYIRVEIITRGSSQGRILAYLHFEGVQNEGAIEIIKCLDNKGYKSQTTNNKVSVEVMTMDRIEDEITNFITEYYSSKS